MKGESQHAEETPRRQGKRKTPKSETTKRDKNPKGENKEEKFLGAGGRGSKGTIGELEGPRTFWKASGKKKHRPSKEEKKSSLSWGEKKQS